MREKLANIEERYNEIIGGYSDLDEIGFDELRSTWNELDELKNEAIDLSTDLLVGITRENGRFKNKDNIEFDLGEISEITGTVNRFIDRVYTDISRINAVERSKKDRFAADFRERNRVRQDIRITENMVASLEADINRINAELGTPSQLLLDELAKSGLSYTPSVNISPDRKFYLEQELNAKEKSLNNFKEALDTYNVEEQRLTEEMDVLKYGGVLPGLEESRNVKTNENEMDIDNLDENKDIDNDQNQDFNNSIVTPALGNTDPLADELTPIGTPIDNPNASESENDNSADNSETEENTNENNVIPVPAPLPAVDGESLDADDLSEMKADPEDGRFKAEVIEPKPTLLSKIKNILKPAAVFLTTIAVLGTGVHTGIMAKEGRTTINQTIIVSETDKNNNENSNDTPENEKDKDKPNSTTNGELEQNKPTPSNPTSGSNNGNGSNSTSDLTPTPTPSTPGGSDISSDNTIKVGQGEEAVDLKNNVSISNDGTRYQDGVVQDKVALEYDANGVANVSESHINESLAQSTDENVIDSSQVDAVLTPEEKANYMEAVNEQGPVDANGDMVFTEVQAEEDYGSFNDYASLFENSDLSDGNSMSLM